MCFVGSTLGASGRPGLKPLQVFALKTYRGDYPGCYQLAPPKFPLGTH